MAAKVKLYSIQSLAAFAELWCTGSLQGCWSKVDPAFVDAYKWVLGEMDWRISHPKPSHGRPPVWAWHRYGNGTTKPNTTDEGFAEPGTKLVLLTLEVEESRVLLSDFDAWHCVLNNVPVPDEDSEPSKSWPTIFDLKTCREIAEQTEADQCIQATLNAFYKSDVKHMEFFTAR